LVHQGNCNGATSEGPYLNGVTEERADAVVGPGGREVSAGDQ